MSEKKEEISLPFLMDYMSSNNRRMLVALLTVCITFILTIVIFVVGYTIREKNWLDTLQRTGVTNGVYEQSSEGSH